VEIVLPHLLELQVSGNRPPAIGSVLEDDGAPEVGHLLQVRLPFVADDAGEDRSEPLVGANPAVELANQRADEGPVETGTIDGKFRHRAYPFRRGDVHDGLISGIFYTSLIQRRGRRQEHKRRTTWPWDDGAKAGPIRACKRPSVCASTKAGQRRRSGRGVEIDVARHRVAARIRPPRNARSTDGAA